MPATSLSEGTVLFEKDGNTAVITLNRPDTLNAINQKVLTGLSQALGLAAADSEIRAVVLTGAGKAFSSGGDLVESAHRAIVQSSADESMEAVTAVDVYMRIWDLPKPVIAAVKGYAVGQGCELAAICDITIAAEDAKLGEIQIRHGFGTPMLITPFMLGLKRAKEVLLVGDFLTAQEAKDIGMVNRVVPADKVLEEAVALAKKIASLPAGPVQQNKLLINRSFEARGIIAGINFSHDSVYADIVKKRRRDEEGLAHLRRLQEEGWDSFKSQRDAQFNKGDAEKPKEGV